MYILLAKLGDENKIKTKRLENNNALIISKNQLLNTTHIQLLHTTTGTQYYRLVIDVHISHKI